MRDKKGMVKRRDAGKRAKHFGQTFLENDKKKFVASAEIKVFLTFANQDLAEDAKVIVSLLNNVGGVVR